MSSSSREVQEEQASAPAKPLSSLFHQRSVLVHEGILPSPTRSQGPAPVKIASLATSELGGDSAAK